MEQIIKRLKKQLHPPTRISKDKGITENNIKGKIETIKAVSSGKVQELSHMRKVISNHMMDSITTSAHVYLMTEIDVTRSS